MYVCMIVHAYVNNITGGNIYINFRDSYALIVGEGMRGPPGVLDVDGARPFLERALRLSPRDPGMFGIHSCC
jgi:hypothetical protein